MEWNPNSTATKGLEWLPYKNSSITLDGPTKATVMSWTQTAGATVVDVVVYCATIPQRGGVYVVEVYDNESILNGGGYALVTANPNEDVSGVGSTQWTEDDGTTTNIFDQIDEGALDVSDYIKVAAGNSGVYVGRVNTGGLSLTGKRILSVNLIPRVNITGGAIFGTGLRIGGVNYPGVTGIANFTGNKPYTWYYNPATKKPWTIADIQAFDTTDGYYLDGNNTGSTGQCEVQQVRMLVEYVTENRLAVGILDDSASALTENAYNVATLTTPTGGAWTKDASGKHILTVRRLNGWPTGSVIIPQIEALATAPNATGFDAAADPTFGYFTVEGVATPRLFGAVYRATGPAELTDSQPYFQVTWAQASNGLNHQQEFSNAAAVAYGWLRFLAYPGSAATADLLVKIKRRSDNVQIGGTFTLTVAQWNALASSGAPPSAPGKVITGQLASAATLAAATQYYLEFSTTETNAANHGWFVGVLQGTTGGAIAGFGGTTDAATLSGGAESTAYDFAATVSTLPTVPANFAGSVTSQDVADTVCGITVIPRVSLSWTATALGGSFARYEIRRTEDGGTTWTSLVTIGTESTAAFIDYEGKFGIQVGYQIRVVRTDGATSDWSTTVNATKPLTGIGCALFFVSNYAATYNCAYDYQPQTGYEFLESGEQVTQPIYGADFSLGFNPLENRGARISWLVNVAFNNVGVQSAGKATFDALRNIARAPLPYVCVLDHYGQRFTCLLRVPNGTMTQPAHVYMASVEGTEVPSGYVVGV